MIPNDLKSWQGPFIDTHCHLDDSRYTDDRTDLIQGLAHAGVIGAICIGCDLESSLRVVNLANQWECIRATVGTHPHEAKHHTSEWSAQYQQLATQNPNIVAIGEIGLDYHYNFSDPTQQRSVFQELLELAVKLDLPVVIHSREADDDVVAILSDFKGKLTAIMHTFAGDVPMAETLVDWGHYISFSGTVTFKNAEVTRDVAKAIPRDRALIETDSPYLTPIPYRGKRNDPRLVGYVADMLGTLWSVSSEEVGRLTTENAQRAFRTTFKGKSA